MDRPGLVKCDEYSVPGLDLEDRSVDRTVQAAEGGNISAQRKLLGKRVHDGRAAPRSHRERRLSRRTI